MGPTQRAYTIVLSKLLLCQHYLHRPSEVSDEYEAIGKSDNKLTDERGGRGRREIGLLRHKSIAASPILSITSDSIWHEVHSG